MTLWQGSLLVETGFQYNYYEQVNQDLSSKEPIRFFASEGWKGTGQQILKVYLQGTGQDALEKAKTLALETGFGGHLDQAKDRVAQIPEVFAFRLSWEGQLLFWDRDNSVSEMVVFDLPGFLIKEAPEFWMKRRGTVASIASPDRGRLVSVIAPTTKEAVSWATSLFETTPQEGLIQIREDSSIQALYLQMRGKEPHYEASTEWPWGHQARAGLGTIHRPLYL